MEFKAFLEQLLTAVNGELPAGRTARYKTVNKMNGVVYTGMYLDAGEKGSISPLVYMEPIFEGISGPEALPEIAKELAKLLISPVRQEASAFRVSDFEFSKERIVFRLVNRADNETALQNFPHRDFLDLAVIYGVLISGDEESDLGVAQVTFEIMNRWGVDEETLYKLAKENSPRILGDEVRSLPEIMGSGWAADTEEDRRKIREAGRYFMVSNRHAFLGAGTLLYSGKYREIAEKVGTDLYLLPTSVHEVMTVPAPGHTPEEMRRLLASIMSEDPKKEHCLTENVYYYSAEKGSILIAL